MKKSKNWINKVAGLFVRSEKGYDENEQEEEISLEEKINNALQKCEQDRVNAEKEIEEIKKWATDAILKVFEVPSRLWYSELDNYEEIKQLEENSKISSHLVQKCDNIINGYRNQISLRNSKLRLCETLIEKYIKTRDKFIDTKDKMLRQIEEEKKLKELELHSDRLKEMDEKTSNVEYQNNTTEQLESIDTDIKTLEDEFMLNEEFYVQMDKLNKIYSDDDLQDNSLLYKKDIEKIITEIKNEEE